MVSYVVFLRGINVGGHKLIAMEDLKGLFAALGFKNIKTLIQSGNVIFEAPETSTTELVRKIAKKLEKELGYEVPLVLKTTAEIREIIKSDPFKKVQAGEDVKQYAAFLAEAPKFNPTLPLKATKEGLEIFALSHGVVFCISRPTGGGRYGFPNAFIESEFGVPATTRNWNTVLKLVQ